MFYKKSKVDLGSNEFKTRKKSNHELSQKISALLEETKKGGGEKSVKLHKDRNKLLARERIGLLIDEGTAFLELSTLAAYGMYDDASPGAGIVTGVGKVSGKLVMIVANDATVKGGTYFPITVKKHLRAQEIAEKNLLPCIYLVDSGGAYLPLQSEVFPDRDHFGRIFYNQARMSSRGITQISCVMGSCTAGGAYVPAMSDLSVIVRKQGTIFLAGPPLVKAATGEEVSSEELGGAEVHTAISGVADYLAENDEHALEIVRDLVKQIKDRSACDKFVAEEPVAIEKPIYEEDEIYGVMPESLKEPFDINEILLRICDGSKLSEFKQEYGKTVICAFANVHGYKVGFIANNGVLYSESALKATHFIELCDKQNIPIVFIQNISGFMVGKKAEHEGIAKNGAKMVTAVASTKVPKITIIVGGSYGAGNYGMCGRAYDPRFLFCWPNARISVMGGEQAAGVLTQVKKSQLLKEGKLEKDIDFEALEKEILDTYENESSALFSTARLWDDGIILPHQTRDVLGLCLEIVSKSEFSNETGFGLFRM